MIIVEIFLGNHKIPNYETIVQNMLTNFNILRANTSIELDIHKFLDKFSDNVGNYSRKQRERFCQDLKVLEERYQG